VKRYSSGMYVRLAFAVAAHLEPEIMVVDEVLAVGDADFQRKCLGKMNEVSGAGRTVIFVSHQMSSIKTLCNRGIYLKKGGIVYDGTVDQAINLYMESSAGTTQQVQIAERKRDGECTFEAKIVDLKVYNNDRENPEFIDATKPVKVMLTIQADENGRRCGVQIRINDGLQNVILADSPEMHSQIFKLNQGLNHVECELAPLNLYKGDYHIDLMLYLPRQGIMDNIKDAYDFSINDFDPYHTGMSLERVNGKGIYHVENKFSEVVFAGTEDDSRRISHQ
jgi:lipopolysaccharide transport system ATP-binding protein